jgi:hypothetical protein
MPELRILADQIRGMGGESGQLAFMDDMLVVGERMRQMNDQELESLAEMIGKANEADGDSGEELARTTLFLLFELCRDRPGISLGLMQDMAGMGDFSPMSDMMMGRGLSDWASRDPRLAAAWYEEQKGNLKGYQVAGFARELIVGAAKTDPVEAHRILGSIGESENEKLYLDMVKAAHDSEDRLALLEILREEHPAGAEGEDTANYLGILAVGDNRGHRGFDLESEWIEQAGFTDEEMADVLAAVRQYAPSDEKGEWLEWLQERDLPPEDLEGQTTSLLENWILEDFQSAGEWLVEQPAGEFWNQTAGVFAKTIFTEFPQEAVLWLESIPPGEDRLRVSRSFYQQWPKETPEERAAAESFAEREGLR